MNQKEHLRYAIRGVKLAVLTVIILNVIKIIQNYH